MPTVIPFRAVRPTRDKVSLVAARAYDHYTEEGRKFRMDRNPFSFLHILNPGYKYHKEITGPERFSMVRNRYLEFKEDGVFIQDEMPCYYAYRIIDRDGLTYTGFIAAASVADYEKDVIKKHESTLRQREELFMEYLDTVGFNAEAVLLTYPDNDGLNNILDTITQERAEYEFTTTYRDTHYLWPIAERDSIEKIKAAFSTMGALYIADGHHRSSSSYLLAKAHQDADGVARDDASYQYFMSYLIPESHLRIYEFNRLVTDLNGLSKEQFLIALDATFRIENRGTALYKPSKKHHFSMYLDGEYYSLYLRHAARKFESPLQRLDTQILYDTILYPLLGIEDMRHDERLAYADGRKDMVFVKDEVDRGAYKVGFGMLPVTMEALKEIADAGLTMPPKSTYIEPKLRSGITIYEF